MTRLHCVVMKEKRPNLETKTRHPGPRRSQEAPVGPDAVRRAVLDVAAELFADRGVATTTRKEIAEVANVNPNLINRYIGSRDALVFAVIEDLGAKIVDELADAPMGSLSHDPDAPISRVIRIMAQVIGARERITARTWNPVLALAETAQTQFGL